MLDPSCINAVVVPGWASLGNGNLSAAETGGEGTAVLSCRRERVSAGHVRLLRCPVAPLSFPAAGESVVIIESRL